VFDYGVARHRSNIEHFESDESVQGESGALRRVAVRRDLYSMCEALLSSG